MVKGLLAVVVLLCPILAYAYEIGPIKTWWLPPAGGR